MAAQLKEKTLVEIGRLPAVREEFYLIRASRKIENEIASKLFESFRL